MTALKRALTRCRFHTGRLLCAKPPAPGSSPTTPLGLLREVPVVHKTTWLEALRTREEQMKDAKIDPSGKGVAFAYNDVKTRAVTPRSSKDSFTSVVLPFKDDKWCLDAYINAFGRLRIGQIFQDLDRLSGIIANKHCEPAEPVIVTASVDRILLLKRIEDLTQHNVVLWGCVTWTGRSSIEITINACTTDKSMQELSKDGGLTLEDARKLSNWMVANFTFVARDPATQKAFPVNNLRPETRQELQDFVLAETYNKRKKSESRKTALTVSMPSPEESKLVHELWLKSRQYTANPDTKPDKMVFMENTKVYSTTVMQPQYRNRHSYMIFGGYMMRQAFELAYACAGAFAHTPARFVALDTVNFRNPVPVGSVLYMTAFVSYTQPYHSTMGLVKSGSVTELTNDGTLIQVQVQSVVRGITNNSTADAGSFVFSFFVEKTDYAMIPRSYDEMMLYLEGRRRTRDSEQYLQDASLISH